MKTDLIASRTTANPSEAAAEPEYQAEPVNSVKPAMLPVTPMEMLSMAVSQGADLDKLQKLMDLQERWEANEARKAFVVAMARFKENPPQIVKDKQVAFLDVKYKHAELDQVAGKIGHALSLVGISHRWALDQTGGPIKVTCILTHIQGHSESVTLEGVADQSGKKNAVQGIGSTVSYLQRYTLLAATGLATGEDDNDGNGPGSNAVQFVLDSKDKDEVMERFGVEYKLAAQAKNARIQRELIGARDQRIEQLKKAVQP